MADWAENRLEIIGQENEVLGFIEKFHAVDNKGNDCVSFENIIPLVKSNDISDIDLCSKVYGVKHSVGFNAIFENNIIFFSTPWNTPLEFFIEASRLYQSLTINVKAEYYEYDDETFSVQNGVILNTSIDLEQRKLHREFNYRLLSGL